MLRKFQVFKNFVPNLSRKVYAFISILHKMFLLSLCLIVWLQMKDRLLANVSNKEMEGGIWSNLACFLSTLEIFQILHFIKKESTEK